MADLTRLVGQLPEPGCIKAKTGASPGGVHVLQSVINAIRAPHRREAG